MVQEHTNYTINLDPNMKCLIFLLYFYFMIKIPWPEIQTRDILILKSITPFPDESIEPFPLPVNKLIY